MAKRTDWTYLIGLLWLGTFALIAANTAKLIPNHVVSSRIFIVAIIIGFGANLTGLYLLKKND
ncbi:hypothetical protein [Bacillus bingmayongensis]|uniref:hypothetical protein n=1 Tax=Bacillus bingmayongensis TaxID=1150157 RepID=UPI001C8E4AD1|nr:hypothetical protein [Bacillus bingmayongensis]MBY0598752.1 hypothetical protein [Bacillus bingmayongensis]